MSLIVEKTRKNDAFDSQGSAGLRRAMADLAAATSPSGGARLRPLFFGAVTVDLFQP
jgi:hypothetical protein